MNARVTRELPPYQALVVVDVKDFGGRPGREHEALTERIPEILAASFARAGLQSAWTERTFGHCTGDGFAAGFRPAVLPFLVDPLLTAVQEELTLANSGPSAGAPPLRMRMSVHVGPLTASDIGRISDGSGAARVAAHRLVDAPAVKALLVRSTEATCVAGIISERVVEDVVRSGFTATGIDHYVPVTVRLKELDSVAYLRVPEATGDLLVRGLGPPIDPTLASAGEPHATTYSARTSIGTATGSVHTGDGDQYNDGRMPRPPGRRRCEQ